jgi:hypothetical protein
MASSEFLGSGSSAECFGNRDDLSQGGLARAIVVVNRLLFYLFS